ncbi:MAG: phosphoenolpyruvate synthase [Acidobacteria bacterium]|nr:phosphoenolpyruvate synthase [Acidobacteriota bacterium]
MGFFWKQGSKADSLHDLMQYHVQEVLLVSSMYDAFLLEEDGRLSHRVFGDFMDLDLHHIPRITRVSSASEALEALEAENFDLVITMPRLSDMSPFQFGTKAKEIRPGLPIVLLTYAPVQSRVLKQIRRHDSIDKIFYWFGDSKIFLAIIKSIEDMKNLESDSRYGVNIILVVEDSPWYYSAFLPMLYTEIIKQTRRIVSEGANDVQRMLRIRARPKIVSAETFEEAKSIVETYKGRLLGVISDIRYPKNGKMTRDAGLQLVRLIREEIPDLGIVLQSSEQRVEREANKLGVRFINKNSPTLLEELQSFMLENFGFGDFVFRMPDGRIVGRARTLREFGAVLRQLPVESLLYHTSRNHVSIWLRARTEFDLAEKLRPRKVSDFETIEKLRQYLIESIEFSISKERSGIISDFSASELQEEDNQFSRIGSGSMGGKARGVAFMNAMMLKSGIQERYPGVRIRTPATFVICTDVYGDFLQQGNLRDRAFSATTDEEVFRMFRESYIPSAVEKDLRSLLMKIRHPIAVRSSSLLEDSQALPFSGVYKTYMLPNSHPNLEVRYRQLVTAIKMVYASVFSMAARQYVSNSNFRVEEEQMAILIQRVSGIRYGELFYPTVSGTAQSYNFYPLSHLNPHDGIMSLVMGIGKSIGRDRVFRVSPANPAINPLLRKPLELPAKTQRKFFALHVGADIPELPIDENANLLHLPLDRADQRGVLSAVASVLSLEAGTLDDNFMFARGKPVLTFSKLLKGKFFPFPELIREILDLGEQAVGTPVGIEFAVNLYPDGRRRPEFSFLQIRPLVAGNEFGEINTETIPRKRIFCRSGQTMGNGLEDKIHDLIYIDPEHFSPEATREIAAELGEFNRKLEAEGRNCILIGFGRWGSSDPSQGIPVNWTAISQARILVEANLKDFKADASRGNHFFQHMLANKLGYFYVSGEGDDFVDWDWLRNQPVFREGKFLRHLRFKKSLVSRIDGRASKGVLQKPKGTFNGRK